jgi:hypothetical protein
MATIPEELESLLARLSEADQRRLLEYARALVPVETLALDAGSWLTSRGAAAYPRFTRGW